MKSGKLRYLDMDLTAPNFSTSNIDSYDGDTRSYNGFLQTSRPVGWREEMSKLEKLEAAGNLPGVTRSVRIRCISPGVVIPSQVSIPICQHCKSLNIIFYRSDFAVPYTNYFGW